MAFNEPATILRGSAGSGVVPLDELDLEAGEFKNPRSLTGLAPTEIRALAESIWAHGLKDPLKVRRYAIGEPPEVHFLVVDGQRRVKALRYLNETGYLSTDVDVPVVNLDVDDGLAPVLDVPASMEAYVESLVIGQQRAPLSSFEQVIAAATLATGKKKGSEIATILGRSDAWVSRMLTAWKASTPELRASFAQGAITDEQFKELATVKPAEQPAVVKDIADTRAKGERREARDKSRAEAAKNTPAPKKRAATIAREKAAAALPAARPATLPPPRALVSRDVNSGEILAMAKIIAPQDQYTKGVLDMCRCIQGEQDTSRLGKPFRIWLDRVKKKMGAGAGRAMKAAEAKAPRAKPAKKGKEPSHRPVSKACTARHHVRCQQMISEGKTELCTCACHEQK